MSTTFDWEAAAEEAYTDPTPSTETETQAQEPVVETDTSEEQPVEEPATTEVATVEGDETAPAAGWWEDHLDDDIVYKGQTYRLSDILDSGLRRDDYTRKTQDLARFREAAEWGLKVRADLQKDPVAALRKIATDLQLISADQDEYDPSEEPDPALVELHQVKQQIAELSQARIMEETRQEIAAARAAHPDWSDDVLGIVAEFGGQGYALSIEDGYALWKGRQAQAKEDREARAKAKAKELADRQAAARQASEAVGGGHSPAAGTETDPDRFRKMSVEEIFEAEYGGGNDW